MADLASDKVHGLARVVEPEEEFHGRLPLRQAAAAVPPVQLAHSRAHRLAAILVLHTPMQQLSNPPHQQWPSQHHSTQTDT